MVALLDVNLLVALAWPNHVHHRLAAGWFERNYVRGWATCPATQAGFTRVSSNHRVLPDARSPQEAMRLLAEITKLPHHVFWSDDVRFCESRYVARAKLVGYTQVTDAHLLAIALRHKGCLATLDGGIRSIVPDGFAAQEAVCVLTEK
jgi:toxin-antitoxin system PIN domain toxin